jgi:cobalt-zinc-cadmium resistance protein CzcA
VLQANNLNVGAGYIERNGEQFLVRVLGQLATRPLFRRPVVSTHDNVLITVNDVATINIGKELRTGAATQDGLQNVIGTAMMLLGGNSRKSGGRGKAKGRSLPCRRT